MKEATIKDVCEGGLNGMLVHRLSLHAI